MCKICGTKPVYEFTNKRKVCENCFIRWFNKKVLYIIRKYKLIKKGEIIGYYNKRDFRSVVLKEVLEMYNEKGMVELVRLPAHLRSQISGSVPSSRQGTSLKEFVNLIPKSSAELRDRVRSGVNIKIAMADTIDTESQRLVHELIKGNSRKIKSSPVEGKVIKPLFLFTDYEVLLYAKLKKLKFNKVMKEKGNKRTNFVNELEKKHPEVKRAVVKGIMELK